MMTAAEKLRQRAAAARRTARISCGELGEVTIEALSVRDIELLLRSGDGERKLFYAACRELQLAGEELRQRGEIAAPDGILLFISDAEAAAAAQAVLSLSGVSAPEAAPEDRPTENSSQEEQARQTVPPPPAKAPVQAVLPAGQAPAAPVPSETPGRAVADAGAQTTSTAPAPSAPAATPTLSQPEVPSGATAQKHPLPPQESPLEAGRSAPPAVSGTAAPAVPLPHSGAVPAEVSRSEAADLSSLPQESAPAKPPSPAALQQAEVRRASRAVSSQEAAAGTGTAHRPPESLRESRAAEAGEALFRVRSPEPEPYDAAPPALSEAALAEGVARQLLAGLRRASYVR